MHINGKTLKKYFLNIHNNTSYMFYVCKVIF